MTTRVGVLLVHGIGEQRRFEHLEAEARQIVSALEATQDTLPKDQRARVTVDVRTSADAGFKAEQQTWLAEDAASVRVDVLYPTGDLTEIHFREVWWADLDEPADPWHRIRFWAWGFSQWALRGFRKSPLSGASQMFLPGNPDQWGNEQNALDVREDFGIPLDHPFPVTDVLGKLGAHVVPHGRVPCAESIIRALRTDFAGAWSAIALPWPNAAALIIYNDGHSQRRRHASLAEECFHLCLGHPMSTIRCYQEESTRTYTEHVEREAYDSGAAALVPYKSLHSFIHSGWDVVRIANHYEVSVALVEYRAKVTKQYKRLQHNAAA